MNREQIEEWMRRPNHALNGMDVDTFRALCDLALSGLLPQGEPVAIVYVAEPILEGTHGRWLSWLTAPSNIPNGTKLYAAPPADEVVVPREPTEEMIDAAIKWRDGLQVVDGPVTMRDQYRACYIAMLAAAPKGGE